jgi:hypothetical protein
MVADLSGNGYGTRVIGYPHDWTEGTNVLPASGSIVIPNPPNGAKRKWLMIQNQSAGVIGVSYQSVTALGNVAIPNLFLDPGSGVGAQGGGDERGAGAWSPNGTVTITGTPGAQLLVIEVLG